MRWRSGKFPASEAGISAAVFDCLRAPINVNQPGCPVTACRVANYGHRQQCVASMPLVRRRSGADLARDGGRAGNWKEKAEAVRATSAGMARQMRSAAGPDCLDHGGEPTGDARSRWRSAAWVAQSATGPRCLRELAAATSNEMRQLPARRHPDPLGRHRRRGRPDGRAAGALADGPLPAPRSSAV